MRPFAFALLSAALLASPIEALEFQPWISPLWEFETQTSVWNKWQHKLPQLAVEEGNLFSIHLDLSLTFWPGWEFESGFFVTQTPEESFAYETTFLQLRYQWLDDLSGAPFALVSGVFVTLPCSQFLHSPRFLYHGTTNAEAYLSIGKEWSDDLDWVLHLWGLGGIGIANQGHPWVHALAHADWKLLPYLELDLFAEGLFGCGPLPLTQPFHTYANIHHQTINIGLEVKAHLPARGIFALKSWYNVYAKNFFYRDVGLEISLYVPFGL